jgi:hypothetical protein
MAKKIVLNNRIFHGLSLGCGAQRYNYRENCGSWEQIIDEVFWGLLTQKNDFWQKKNIFGHLVVNKMSF